MVKCGSVSVLSSQCAWVCTFMRAVRVSAGGSLVSDLVLGSLVEIKCWVRLKVQVVTAGTF